jgi:hypothetical protein
MIPRPPCALLLLAVAGCTGSMLRAPGGSEDPAPSGSPYLRAYKEAHYRDLGTHFTGHVTDAELIAETRGARVLFVGDHHHDEDLHVRILALLEQLAAAGLRPVLGTEAVGVQDSALLDAWLRGEIGLSELRARIARRWRASWLDGTEVDSAFYCRLLETARRLGMPAFALEPTPRLPLDERDAAIARTIRAAAGRYRDRLLVIVVGHAHLLGWGRLVERVGLPAVTIGARLSRSLRTDLANAPAGAASGYLRASSGVLFPYPPTADRP